MAQLQVNCALRCEHACETYAYPRDSHSFPSSLHVHLSHLPSLLGVFRPLLLSLAVRAVPASRCWELQVHFWATWIRPAAGSGRKGIGRARRLICGGLRATETSRAHQSLCVHTCQRCVHTVLYFVVWRHVQGSQDTRSPGLGGMASCLSVGTFPVRTGPMRPH